MAGEVLKVEREAVTRHCRFGFLRESPLTFFFCPSSLLLYQPCGFLSLPGHYPSFSVLHEGVAQRMGRY